MRSCRPSGGPTRPTGFAGGQFTFDITVDLPIFGRLIRYWGVMDIAQNRLPPQGRRRFEGIGVIGFLKRAQPAPPRW